MEIKKYDVVIVGTGAAGLFAALQLPKHLQVLMITKDAIKHSDSYLAQGGICVLKDTEDYDYYFEDTMRAGRYENNKKSVEIMIKSSNQIIDKLISYGVEFEHDRDGNLLYTREGAHSTYRILYHQDATGKEITETLIRQVKQRNNITVEEYTTMVDILEKNNTCCGILVKKKKEEVVVILSSFVILATGGIGGLFVHSTNFRHITGDSFAIALRHKMKLENIHYIQIHPTTLYSKEEGRRFLISESVRGEGAVLLNEKRERFVDELLPRDVVTEAIRKEMERFGTEYVYLTFSKEYQKEQENKREWSAEQVQHRFPNIYRKCQEAGYNLAMDLIPVTPAQHYLMGGICVDINGQTSMKCLYAVGETACNGVHGANRLASNSLLESLVFAERSAQAILNQFKEDRNKDVTIIKNNKKKNAAVQEDSKKEEIITLKEKETEKKKITGKTKRVVTQAQKNIKKEEAEIPELYIDKECIELDTFELELEESIKQWVELSEKDRAIYNKNLIISEIKRKDEEFYVKWCNAEN